MIEIKESSVLGLRSAEIGILLAIFFVAAAFDYWRGKLGVPITAKRLAVYGAVILLSAVFFWNTIESRNVGAPRSRPNIPAGR
jgi:hypothetical protein